MYFLLPAELHSRHIWFQSPSPKTRRPPSLTPYPWAAFHLCLCLLGQAIFSRCCRKNYLPGHAAIPRDSPCVIGAPFLVVPGFPSRVTILGYRCFHAYFAGVAELIPRFSLLPKRAARTLPRGVALHPRNKILSRH